MPVNSFNPWILVCELLDFSLNWIRRKLWPLPSYLLLCSQYTCVKQLRNPSSVDMALSRFLPRPCPCGDPELPSYPLRKEAVSVSGGQLLIAFPHCSCMTLPSTLGAVCVVTFIAFSWSWFCYIMEKKNCDLFHPGTEKRQFPGCAFQPLGGFPLLLVWNYFEPVASSWIIEVLSSHQELSEEHFCSPFLFSWNPVLTLGH